MYIEKKIVEKKVILIIIKIIMVIIVKYLSRAKTWVVEAVLIVKIIEIVKRENRDEVLRGIIYYTRIFQVNNNKFF